MSLGDFETLEEVYDVELGTDVYEGHDLLTVGFGRYDVGCDREPGLLGDHRVRYVENKEMLAPEYGEFADAYARNVLSHMDRFTDVDVYLARHDVHVEGVNDDLYSRIRSTVEPVLRSRP